MDKHVLYQKANYYKGKELMTKDDEDASPTRYVKALPNRLFKHELKALKQKTRLSILDLYAIKRFYRLRAYCSSLEPDEKPPVEDVHHEVERCYETLNHTLFTIKTHFNMVYLWKREFDVMSNHNFSYVVRRPHSRFIFTHHVQLIIKEVNYDVEDAVDQEALAI